MPTRSIHIAGSITAAAACQPGLLVAGSITAEGKGNVKFILMCTVKRNRPDEYQG